MYVQVSLVPALFFQLYISCFSFVIRVLTHELFKVYGSDKVALHRVMTGDVS